jgi:hypothetical protein
MTVKNIYSLLVWLKSNNREFTKEGMDVTVATTDGKEYTYQTGDNSYTGGCYHYQHWAVNTLFRNTDCLSMARDIVRGLKGMVAESKDYESAGISSAHLN